MIVISQLFLIKFCLAAFIHRIKNLNFAYHGFELVKMPFCGCVFYNIKMKTIAVCFALLAISSAQFTFDGPSFIDAALQGVLGWAYP